MKLSLEIVHGDQPGLARDFDKPVIRIGRDPTNDLALSDSASIGVSRNHAEIRFIDGTWRVVDLGSTNGTYLNGQRVTDSPIKNGDEIQFGSRGPRVQVSLPEIGAETPTPGREPSVTPGSTAAAGEPIPGVVVPPKAGSKPVSIEVRPGGASTLLHQANQRRVAITLAILAGIGLWYWSSSARAPRKAPPGVEVGTPVTGGGADDWTGGPSSGGRSGSQEDEIKWRCWHIEAGTEDQRLYEEETRRGLPHSEPRRRDRLYQECLARYGIRG